MRFPRFKTLFLFASALLFMLILPMVMADAEQYLTIGVTRDNTYVQDGTGVWTGRAATTYQRVGTYVPFSSPLVADLDADGYNEIVLAENSSIQVVNFTPGIGMVLKDDYEYGSRTMTGFNLRATPYLMDYDSDGFIEIIYFNNSHVFALNYSSGTLTLEQATATSSINQTTATSGTEYFSVKCAPAGQVSTGNNTCIFLATNRTGAGTYGFVYVLYDLDDNTVSYAAHPASGVCEPTGCVVQAYHQFHLADGDDDGFLEAYLAIDNGGNGDLVVTEIELGVPSVKIIRYDNRAVGTAYTDIVVNRLDGANEIVTWSYANGNNYYAYSVKVSTNTTISTAYCGILTCPEGNYASENLIIADDTTYCDYTGDVYFYIRNYDQTDPGANIDTVICLSQYAGEGYKETTVTNAVKNDTDSIFITHQASLYGTTSLLLSQWAVQGGTKQTLPSFNYDEVTVPVDAQISGSLDFIGQNATRVIYYDDAYTNQNVVIDSIAPDTGNSICSGETLTTTLSISDVENDAGNCYARVTWANGTSYSNTSNTTFTGGQSSVDMYFTYTAATPASFIHYYSCRDQYHSAYSERAYSVSYSNYTCGSGLCNCKGYGTPVPTTYAANATVADDVFETVWDEFGITSSTSKTILGLAVVIGVMVSVGGIILSPFAIVAAGILTLIIVTFMGLVSAYILILTLVGLALIYLVLGKVAPSTPGG